MINRLNVRIAVILIGSILISLIGVEILLRVVNYPSHNCRELYLAGETHFTSFNSLLGWSYIPLRDGEGDYGANYSFSSEGFRSKHSGDKSDPNKPKILLIGDSILFGHGLAYEDTIGAKLQNELPEYQVLNFSVQGYTTDQAYLLAKKLIPLYAPKIIITDYIDEHDLRNLTKDRRDFFPCLQYSGTKPMFTLQHGELKQVSHPMKYSDYDYPKIRLLLERTLQGKLENRLGGKELSIKLLEKMYNEAKNSNAHFYILSFNTPSPFLPPDNGLAVTIRYDDPEDPSKYHITEKDHHPNGLGTSKIVREFLQSFEK